MEVKPRSTPTYRIFRDQHGIPQFEPKRGTQSLKDALIYEFPTLETELQLMQAALKRFFDSERKSDFICELPENNLQVSLAKGKEPEVPNPQAALRSWKVSTAYRKSSRTTSRSRASSVASTRGTSRASSRLSSRPQTPIQLQEPSIGIAGEGLMTTWNLSSGQEIEKRKRQPYDPVRRRKVAENRGNACDKHRAQKTTCDPNKCTENKMYSRLARDASKAMATSIGDSPIVRSPYPSTSPEQMISDAEAESIHMELMSIDDNQSQIQTIAHPFSIQSPTALHAQESPSNFHLLAAYNNLNSWNGDFQVSTSPWDSCSASTPGNEISTETSIFIQTPITEEHVTTEARGSTDCSGAQPMVLDYETTQKWPAVAELEIPLDCMDDPFMGWENKRTSHNLENYDWVLSHVENM